MIEVYTAALAPDLMVMCDGCGLTIAAIFRTEAKAATAAEQQGWHVDGLVSCPDCQALDRRPVTLPD